MRVDKKIGCRDFPCADVVHDCYIVPRLDIQAGNIRLAMIAESTPPDPSDYYYARGNPRFQETTVQAFRDAGAEVSSIRDLVKRGVYFTTAVKCGKTGSCVKAGAINECSHLLEGELALFHNLQVIMLMGDVAIKSLNRIAKRLGEGRVVPAGSTYKIRHGRYYFKGKRVFPSYLQAGPAFFIEQSKRRMIGEDICSALKLLD